MAKFTYLKYDKKGNYVEFEQKFDETLYNNIGYSYEDYLANKWVLLSNAQVAFHDENPNATVYEVWNMQMTPVPERTLDNAKDQMIATIDAYDSSDAVNSFTVNGSIEGWFTPAERSNYKSSIDAAKLVGLETLSFFVGDLLVTLPTATAEQLLAQVQLYADQCYIITKQHKSAVNALTAIEDVDAYDYTVGYPEKLNFDIE